MSLNYKTILISIHSAYSDLIFNKKKTVELRRKFDPALTGSRLMIYSTLPTGAIIGHARIRAVHALPIREIWEKFSEIALINESDFWEYYSGLEQGFAIEIIDPLRFHVPITLNEMRSKYKINPPQSYMFLRGINSELLQYEQQ